MNSYVLGLLGRLLLRCLQGMNLILLLFLGLVWMFSVPQNPEESVILWASTCVIVGSVLSGAVVDEYHRERSGR